jgi:hypothetical protein
MQSYSWSLRSNGRSFPSSPNVSLLMSVRKGWKGAVVINLQPQAFFPNLRLLPLTGLFLKGIPKIQWSLVSYRLVVLNLGGIFLFFSHLSSLVYNYFYSTFPIGCLHLEILWLCPNFSQLS